MMLLKMLVGWVAIVVLVAIAVTAQLVGSAGVSKMLWWVVALVAVVAAINTSSYR